MKTNLRSMKVVYEGVYMSKTSTVRRGVEKTLKIRYKNSLGIHTRLVLGPPRKFESPGKVLRVTKVSWEEIHKVGEFNDMPERLMREFRTQGGDRHPVLDPVIT